MILGSHLRHLGSNIFISIKSFDVTHTVNKNAVSYVNLDKAYSLHISLGSYSSDWKVV